MKYILPVILVLALGFSSSTFAQSSYIGIWPPRGVFNVMDYGATGNGSTDDTASIQLAEVAAESISSNCGGASGHCGAELMFPCGNYKIASGPIMISGGNAGTGGISWHSLCGPLTNNESATFSGATIVNAGPAPSSVSVTVTSASPGVITWTQGFVQGQPVYFTAATMPTGITSLQTYYVFNPTGSNFSLCTVYEPPGAATCPTPVNTSSTGTTVIGNTWGDAVFADAGPSTLDQLGPDIDDLGFVGNVQSATITFTSSSANVTWTANGLPVGQAIYLTNSGGAVPTTFLVNQLYYIVTTATNTITVSATPGGTAIIANSGGTGTTTGWALLGNTFHARNFMQGHLFHDSFRDTNAAVYLEGSQDFSDWITDSVSVRNANNAYQQAASGTGGGNNIITNSRLDMVQAGQIGVNCGAGGQQLRIIGNHIEGAEAGGINYGVELQCSGVVIMGNEFEDPTAVYIPQAVVGTTNNYRGAKIIGNTITMDSNSYTEASTTCTTSASSANLTSCGSLAGIVAGMQVVVSNTDVAQMAFVGGGTTTYAGGASSPTSNQLFGGIYVASTPVVGGSTVVMTNNGSAAASPTITFEFPTYSWPCPSSACTGGIQNYFSPVVSGNTYTTFHGPSTLGNDGY